MGTRRLLRDVEGLEMKKFGPNENLIGGNWPEKADSKEGIYSEGTYIAQQICDISSTQAISVFNNNRIQQI